MLMVDSEVLWLYLSTDKKTGSQCVPVSYEASVYGSQCVPVSCEVSVCPCLKDGSQLQGKDALMQNLL